MSKKQSDSPLRAVSIGHSISRYLKPTSKRALPDEKLSLNDDCEIKPNEKAWFVKMNVTGQTKQLERLLVVGPRQLRLLIPDTYEEVGKFPYKRMKEFSHNISYKMFQFTWYPTSTEEETYYFHTSKCLQIQGAIGLHIKELLKEQKIDDPEAILQKCTYRRPPQVEKMKTGGRQRSTQSSTTSPTKTREKNPAQKSPTPLHSKSQQNEHNAPDKKLLSAKSLPPEKPQKRSPIKRSVAVKQTKDESSSSDDSSNSLEDSAAESV
jgi:hypothetical protein